MRDYLTAKRGWQTLIVAIVAYEAICAEEELLSRGLDRLLEKHPIWPRAAVLAVALHLINWIPKRIDPISLLFHVTRSGKVWRGCNQAAGERPQNPLPGH